MIFLLYSWGSLFGVPIRARLVTCLKLPCVPGAPAGPPFESLEEITKCATAALPDKIPLAITISNKQYVPTRPAGSAVMRFRVYWVAVKELK